jgi:hypothetical protein
MKEVEMGGACNIWERWEMHTTFLLENLKGRDHLEEYYSGSERNRMERCGFYSSSYGWEPVASCCEHGNEPSGSMKGGEFCN